MGLGRDPIPGCSYFVLTLVLACLDRLNIGICKLMSTGTYS